LLHATLGKFSDLTDIACFRALQPLSLLFKNAFKNLHTFLQLPNKSIILITC